MSTNGDVTIAVQAEGVEQAGDAVDGDGGLGGGGGGGDGGGGGGQFGAFTKGGIVGGILASLESVVSFVKPILDILNAFLAPIAVILLRLLQPFMTGLIKLLPPWLNFMDAVLGFLGWWEGILNGIYGWLFALPGKIWQAIKNGASWIANGAASIGAATWDAIKSGAAWIVNGAVGIAEETWKAIKNGAAWIANGTVDLAKGAWDAVTSVLNDLWDEIKSLPGDIGSAIGNKIPQFASGGVVSGPTLATVGEAGPEAIIPLDRLEAMLSQQGGGGSTTVQIGGGLAPFVESVNRDPDISL